MTLDTLRELLEYNTWANRRLLDAVARLDPDQLTRVLGGSYPSVQATLTHILWAEWLWLERWQGKSPMELFTPEEFPSVSDFRTRWGQVQAAQSAFLAARRARRSPAGAALHESERGGLGVCAVADDPSRREPLHVSPRPGDEHAAASGGAAGDDRLPRVLGRTTNRPMTVKMTRRANGG